MTNVLVIAERGLTGFFSSCGYLRLFLPLTKPGVERSLKVRFVAIDSIAAYPADVIITHRFALTNLADVEKVREHCRKTNAQWIFDLDDDLLALADDHPESGHYRSLKPIILSSAANADQMWVSTPTLAETYQSITDSVAVVPNTLDHRVWRPGAADTATQDGPTRFVYMGTSTHKPDFEELIAPGFEMLAREFGNRVSLETIGVLDRAAAGKPWSMLVPPHASAIAYPAFATWMRSLNGYAVGLAPLRDTQFNCAKSNIKWLEYSGMGLATIAADLPPYRTDTRPGQDIVLAEPTADAFFRAMRALVVEPSERQRIVREARERALELVRQSEHDPEPRVSLIQRLVEAKGGVESQVRISHSMINASRLDRKLLATSFLRGQGIEVGALHNPLAVPEDVRVRYVDRLTKQGLYEHYPELREYNLVEVDIVDNGETLEKLPSASQNFIIANHFFEHCQDPIATLTSFSRVLTEGGVVYMAIPDKRFTFDKDRDRTSLEHLIEDHREGPERSRSQHYREWVTQVEPHFGRRYTDEEAAARIDDLSTQDYSIHFHAWLPEDIAELLAYCIRQESLPFEVLFAGEFNENSEMIYVLRKR